MTNALAKQSIEMQDGMPMIRTIEDQFRFAEMAIQSGLVPESFKNAQAVMIAWAFGAELGLSRMQSLFNIAVVGNKPTIYGKAIVGVVQSKGVLESFKEWFEGSGDDMTAHCEVKRKGFADTVKKSFSVADAKRAGLWMKKTYNGKDTPWVLYPKDMMTYKARARAFSTLFGDVLCGMPVYEDYKEVFEVTANERAVSATATEPIKDDLLSQSAPDDPPFEDAPKKRGRPKKEEAPVAQETEQVPSKNEVEGASPSGSTIGEQLEEAQAKREAPKYACAACEDTKVNSNGKPCPICQKEQKPLKNQSDEKPKGPPINTTVCVFDKPGVSIGKGRHKFTDTTGNTFYTNVAELIERIGLNIGRKVEVNWQEIDTRNTIVSILAKEE